MEPVWSRAAAQTQHPSPAREALTDELKPSSPYKSLQSNYRVHRIMVPRPILELWHHNLTLDELQKTLDFI